MTAEKTTAKEVESMLNTETEIETETIVSKWSNYSKEVQDIIEKYNGKDVFRYLIGSDGRIKNYDQMKKEAKLLADNDLYNEIVKETNY